MTASLLLGAAIATTQIHVETASAAPSPADTKKATDLFLEGRKIYDAGGPYPTALQKFQASYDTVSSPNSLVYVARCQTKMGNHKESWRTFKRVIAEADARAAAGDQKYKPTRDSAAHEIIDVQNLIGMINVTVSTTSPGAVARVNGAQLAPADLGQDFPVDPGPVELTLEVPGFATSSQKLNLKKGERQVVTLTPGASTAVVVTPPPQPPPKKGKTPFLPVAIAFGGVGVAGMVMFAVGGAMSTSTFSDLETQCGTKCTDASHNDLIDDGKTQQTVANVGVVVGSVGLAASATFFILAATVKPKAPKTGEGEPTVALDLGPAWAGLHGTF
ncbi:MAG: hypothetical protein U0414_42775 [Polyangiaceae bacterium]